MPALASTKVPTGTCRAPVSGVNPLAPGASMVTLPETGLRLTVLANTGGGGAFAVAVVPPPSLPQPDRASQHAAATTGGPRRGGVGTVRGRTGPWPLARSGAAASRAHAGHRASRAA